MKKISVALATYNEENNLAGCLVSVRQVADEIVMVDGGSTDRTVKIAKKFGAKVIITSNPPIFHINKQKALEKCRGEWILQLDADERITPALAREIRKVSQMKDEEIDEYQQKLPDKDLFLRHQKLIEERDGKLGQNTGSYAGFFFPRLNYFLGKYLRFGGVYPDGVVRLVKRGKAFFPCESVHEQIAVQGRVGWLANDLIHLGDPTFRRYLARNNKYINLIVDELRQQNTPKNLKQFINYVFVKPLWWFVLTQIRHKGILDGIQGVIFSFFSALRFPRAYIRYLSGLNNIL